MGMVRCLSGYGVVRWLNWCDDIPAKTRGNGIACLKSSKPGRLDVKKWQRCLIKLMAGRLKTVNGQDGCPDKKLAGTVGGINCENGWDDCMAMTNGKEGWWYLQ